MNVLITGGCGFIGSHLADRMVADGHHVIVIDDLSTGSVRNIEHLRSSKQFRAYFEDMNNRYLLRELVDDADVVYHLAAAVGVQNIINSPVDTIERNINGTKIILELANIKKKPILLASTSEVYGKSEKIPFQEDDDLVFGCPKFARWSYACSKAIDEFLGLAYYNAHDLPVVIARFFNTVGPRQTGRYGMVVPRFIRQSLKNEDITVYGTGSQKRCFTHVKDVVNAITQLIHKPEAYGKIFNIGSHNEISISDLALTVKEFTKSTSSIVKISYSDAYGEGFEDIIERKPDLSNIKNIITYEVQNTLEDIIKDTINYFKEMDKSKGTSIKKAA